MHKLLAPMQPRWGSSFASGKLPWRWEQRRSTGVNSIALGSAEALKDDALAIGTASLHLAQIQHQLDCHHRDSKRCSIHRFTRRRDSSSFHSHRLQSHCIGTGGLCHWLRSGGLRQTIHSPWLQSPIHQQRQLRHWHHSAARAMAFAIGSNARSTNNDSYAIGTTHRKGNQAFATGSNAQSTNDSYAIGTTSSAQGNQAIIGSNAEATPHLS